MSDRSLDRAAVRDRVASLPEEQVETLLKETRDILDAHAEIQQEHRDQAKWVLRVYAPGVGLLIAAFAWMWGQFRMIFPTEPPSPDSIVIVGGYLLFFVAFVFAFYLLVRSAFRFIGILELVAAVLTPQKFNVGAFSLRVFRSVPWYKSVAGVDIAASANETVERVTEAERFLHSIEQPPGHRERVLVDRLCRIQRNEKSINRDMRFLKNVYKILSASLSDALIGSVLAVGAAQLAPLFT